jgi:hypothetical protein
MKREITRILSGWVLIIGSLCTPAYAGQYKNFNVAIYYVNAAQQYNPTQLQQQFDRVWSQIKFDKIYIEVYRSTRFANEDNIEPVKKFFADKGIKVAGGLTLTWNDSAQFRTYSFVDPAHRAECQKAVELAARHFDEVILDDFFFYTEKTDADIAAKGNRSWTQYRLDTMRQVSQDLVLKPARAINPNIKITIKYPNWYEHFQAAGYDLDVQAHTFDAIHTGTETRDPFITDQLLQQYESYLIFRYFDNIRPGGGNHGGWVDTFSTTYADRYPEQLIDTIFAKAPEITLFNWSDLARAQAVQPGNRQQWAGMHTSFDFDDMVKSYQGQGAPGWARLAGYSLEQADTFMGKLGRPIGIKSYKPYQSSGEDFLHNYLGMIGIPIELYPTFPTDADMVLLTESAKYDPDIVSKMKAQLVAGKNVMITSGLLRALQGKGIEDICELEYTDHKVAIKDFLNAYGAGNGTSLNSPDVQTAPILFPEIRFNTNDAWTLIRGVVNAKGYPILLMNRYSKGVFYVLAMPENISDLYTLPPGVLSALRSYVMQTFPVRIEAPPQVCLFAYDNNTFIVQSFMPTETTVNISTSGAGAKLKNLITDQTVEAQAAPQARGRGGFARGGAQAAPRTSFQVKVLPHSYLVFGVEK